MARAELRPIEPEFEGDPGPEAEEAADNIYEAEILPVRRPAGELIAHPVRILAELPPPVVAAGGVVAGAALVSGVKLVNDARKARALRKKREHRGPLIAIMSERIQIDLRPRRR